MKRLLVVAHAPSPNTRAMLAAVRRGASHPDIGGVAVAVRHAFDAGPEDILAADALILGTTENLAYMSGALKDFFDRSYYGAIGRTDGLPYALFIRAGSDGTGTARGVERIVTGLRWRAVRPPLVCRGPYQASFEEDCAELGATMAASLEAGIV